MAIIRHDFGKVKRETIRSFRKLVGLDFAHEERVLANPLPYLERAEQRMFLLEEALRDAATAANATRSDESNAERVEISKAEYDRLLACKSIVLRIVARL